jgi:cytosine/adenosine deaminase-related metal-dependent hydrolase
MPASTDPLLPQELVVLGHLVTFDDARPEIPDGAMYVDRDGTIQAVQTRGHAAPAGFEHARRVETKGIVFPGLIDLHNHIAYNCLPLWIAPDRTVPWTRRDQWPNDKDYKPAISLPANALCHADGQAVLKYVETKAVVGGVTAIQGSAKVAHPFEGWMVRNVEFETFKTRVRTVNQSVRELTTAAQFTSARHDLDEGHAFIYHLAEGSDPKLIADYDGIRDHDCLAAKFVGIHSTALQAPEFDEWHPRGGSIVWSPFSNLWLYRQTTDVAAAHTAGMRICLGADWSPSGSKSLLGELKVADLHNTTRLGGLFEPRDLCAMATCNPADALGWETEIGRLTPGLHADFLVIRARDDTPYRALIDSTEHDVELVAVNGYPMYGTAALMKAANAVNPEPIQVAPGLERTITLRDDRIADANMSWPEILAALQAAREKPSAARVAAIARSPGDRPSVELLPDKPWDDPEDHPELLAEADAATMPPIDSLVHDAAYFHAVAQETLHGGLLNGLAGYYGHEARRSVMTRSGGS